MKNTEWKDTEIGRIPKDWEVKPIGELFTFKNGLNKGKEFFGDGTPIVNYTDVYHKRSLVAKDIRGKVTLSPDEIKRFEVKKGDMFFTRTSEIPEEVGIASVLLEDIPSCVFSGFVLRARPINDSLMPEYCGYGFSTKQIRKDIVNSCTFTTRALTNGQVLSSIKVPLPSISEQQRIATALSDIDMLIDSLDKAIDKKRLVKQGAMQQLLTGKKRLKGFDGEWEEVSLGTLGKVIRGVGFDPEADVFKTKGPNCFTLLRANNIQNNQLIFADVLYVSEEKVSIDQELLNGDILICSANGSKKLVGKSTYIEKNYNHFTFGAFMSVFRCNNKINSKYISYLFQSISYYQQLSNILTGSTINNLSSKDILSLNFVMPKDPIEQYEIGERIRMIDGEISSLIREREKYLRLKDGMMQELLTGKTRLI